MSEEEIKQKLKQSKFYLETMIDNKAEPETLEHCKNVTLKGCVEAIEEGLEHIEKLEKQIPTPENEVPVEYQTLILVDKRDAVMKSEIRDKIKELKSINFNNADDRDYIIKVLKSIIGEK